MKNPLQLFAGIDGGQSSTTAVIADERGNVLGRGTSGPADEIGETVHSTRLRGALEGALAAALDDAKLPRESRFETIVAGVSGYAGAIRGEPPRFNVNHLRLMHDAPIAHAGAFDAKHGVLVIAGTGSVAYGIGPDGEDATAGGWGYLFGDEGSAFWIARSAIHVALQVEDATICRDEKRDVRETDALIATACEHFSTFSVRDMTRRFYRGQISRDTVAAFAIRVLERAADGDAHCIKIARSAAQELVRLATACATAIDLPNGDVAFVGGLIKSPWLSKQLDAELERMSLHRITAKNEPAIGALRLALPMQDMQD